LIKSDSSQSPLTTLPSLREYFIDLEHVLGVCSDGPAKSFAFRRLKYLASKWNLYTLLNEYQELADMKRVPHRDFYNVRKVRLSLSFLSRLLPFLSLPSPSFCPPILIL
jgi:AMP deaminase